MAIANNARNVSYGKPKYGGVAYRAPIGTPLPTTPDDPLDSAFENVGYLTQDGISLATDSSTASITDMGGVTVLTIVTSSSATYTLVMLETNERAAKARFGDQNVRVDELGNMEITHNGLPTDQSSWVFEISLTGNRADRRVLCVFENVGGVFFTPFSKIKPLGFQQRHSVFSPILFLLSFY